MSNNGHVKTTCPCQLAREMRQKYDDPYSAAVECGFVVEMGNAANVYDRQGRIVISEHDDTPMQDYSCAYNLGHLLWDRLGMPDDITRWVGRFALEFMVPADDLRLRAHRMSRRQLELRYGVPPGVVKMQLWNCGVKINESAWENGHTRIDREPRKIAVEDRKWWDTVPLAAMLPADLSDWGVNDCAKS